MEKNNSTRRNPRANIGFVGSSPPASPHHESFKAFIPGDVDMTFIQVADPGASL